MKRTRRGGCLPTLIVLVVVLGIAAVVADRVAASVAEKRIAQLVKDQGARQHVQVGSVGATVDGFPFLTQAWRGRFQGGELVLRDVTVTNAGTRTGTVKISTVNVDVVGLTVPRDVLTGSAQPHDVVADRLNGTASVPTSQLAAAVGMKGLVLSGSGDTVRFTAPVSVAGLSLNVNGTARIRLQGDRVLLDVQNVQAAGVEVPKAIIDQVTSQFAGGATLPPLPLGLKVTSVRLKGTDVEITGEARKVNLASARG